MRVYITGFMGSGKSYWGSKWAEHYKIPFIDLDKQIEAIEGITIDELFEKRGEPFFRQLEAATLRSTIDVEHAIIACGGGTPCFESNMDWIIENGFAVFIKAAPEVLMNNIMDEMSQRPKIKHLNTDNLLPFIKEKLDERNLFYNRANLIIPFTELSDHSLHNLFSKLNNDHA